MRWWAQKALDPGLARHTRARPGTPGPDGTRRVAAGMCLLATRRLVGGDFRVGGCPWAVEGPGASVVATIADADADSSSSDEAGIVRLFFVASTLAFRAAVIAWSSLAAASALAWSSLATATSAVNRCTACSSATCVFAPVPLANIWSSSDSCTERAPPAAYPNPPLHGHIERSTAGSKRHRHNFAAASLALLHSGVSQSSNGTRQRAQPGR